MQQCQVLALGLRKVHPHGRTQGRQEEESSRASLVPTWVASLLTPPAFNQPSTHAAAHTFSFSGALASSLTVDKSKHLLKAKADGRHTHPVPKKHIMGAESLLPTAFLVSQSPLLAPSAQSHAVRPKPPPARLQPKPQLLRVPDTGTKFKTTLCLCLSCARPLPPSCSAKT